MAEGSYEYECERAELLGIEKPDYEEFMRNKKNEEQQLVQDEEEEIEQLNEADRQTEGMRNVSGGLDELNSILQVTQRKLNRFKASCGSLTNLLKIKITGSQESTPPNENADTPSPSNVPNDEQTEEQNQEIPQNGTPRKSDLSKALDNHVDKLDSMIEKAENAQYSMKHQTNQMKRFLN